MILGSGPNRIGRGLSLIIVVAMQPLLYVKMGKKPSW